MSVQLIEEQLKRFLADDSPGVLAICGKWGVGKTHFWNNTVLALSQSKDTFKLPRYGYVSLFGINSLSGLKSEIFTALADREMVGKELDVQTLKENTKSTIFSGLKQLPKLAEMALPNSSTVADALCFASIREAVICIDDLERKSENLNLKDVLGLASLLKEQKKCKIVFLLNDGEEDLNDFHKYHEKVVDLSLRFEPTVEECVQIALPGESDEIKKLRESICKLNITNIRTIKKTERVVNIALPLLTEFEPELSDQAISSIVLYSWCHYRADDQNIPTIDHVTQSSYALLELSDEEFKEADDAHAEKKLWNNLMQQYGYTHTDEFDLELKKGVVDGYFDEAALVAAASKNNDSVIVSKTTGSFRDSWRVYHDSFDDNEDEVIDALYTAFKASVDYVSPSDLNAMVRTFRSLAHDDKADEAIEFYINTKDPTSSVFDLSSYSFPSDVSDAKIRSRFDEIYTSNHEEETVLDILKRISKTDGWHQTDEVILANTTVDEYEQIFRTEKGPRLSDYIRRCLQFGRYTNSSEQKKQIYNRTVEALKRIAEDSKLNKLRMKKFDITFDEPES